MKILIYALKLSVYIPLSIILALIFVLIAGEGLAITGKDFEDWATYIDHPFGLSNTEVIRQLHLLD